MKRIAWAAAGLGLIALSYYLVAYRWADVGGNIEAQIVIVTPAFVAHHALMRRRADRQHAETRDAIAAAVDPPAEDR